MIRVLQSPWAKHFDFIIRETRSFLLISSPYIGREACERMIACKPKIEEVKKLKISLITDLSRDNVLSGATDVSAICDLLDRFPKMEVVFLPSVHAKVYVSDDRVAIVTSANMTGNGLLRNYEYGIRIDDREIVKKIREDVILYGELGTRIDQVKLRFLSEVCYELRGVRARAERSMKSRLRSEFNRRLRRFDDELIRARASGRAPHTIFGDAILYLLARQPMSTKEIHPLVQRIHPDLCDDSVDRVIDGRHYGKKWKHAVRTAQQHLKKIGRIELKEGVWYLKNK